MHDSRPAFVAASERISPAARVALAAASLLAAVLLMSMSPQREGWIMTAIVWGTAVLTATVPFDGLLVLAGFGPIITICSILAGANTTGFHFPEALTLAFLSGAAARRATISAAFAVPARLAWPAVLLIAAAAASAVVQSAVLGAEQRTAVGAGPFLIELVGDYLRAQNTATMAVLFAEGLLLLLIVADLCARTPARRERVLVMMVAGATGAAVLNLVRLVTAAMRHDDWMKTLLQYLASTRVNVQYADWNAAGSYFAMLLLIAAGFVAARRRAYIAPLVLIALALWATGSRAAIAAVPIALGGAALFRMRTHKARLLGRIVAILAVVGAVAVAGWLWYPAQRNDPVAFSISTRLVLWKAGLRMAADAPLFGVGLGRFYVLSPDYAAEVLQTIWRPHENAHNYFVQILAELGVPGLMAFLAVIAFSLAGALRRVPAGFTQATTLAAGLAAFLLTCVTGHPLVVPDVAYPFWMALGIAASAVASPRDAGVRTRPVIHAIAACMLIVLAASVPFRAAAAVRNANRANTTTGLSAWQQEAGVRFRWAGAQSSFYVQSSRRAVSIPLRLGPDARAQTYVRIFFDGQDADRILLQPGAGWRTVRLVRPRQGRDGAFVRIDLGVTDAEGSRVLEPSGPRMLMVGEPSIIW